MVLITVPGRIELRHQAPDPMRPLAGELVAVALAVGERWTVEQYDGIGGRVEVADRAAAEDLLIAWMKRQGVCAAAGQTCTLNLVASDAVLTLNGRRVLLTEQARERAGLTEKTWSSWRARGWPRENPVPDPDGWLDRRTPVWWPETIDSWKKKRPIAGK